MKILIVTQEINRDGDVLGFFHEWVKKFAAACEVVMVVCLYKGTSDVPANVRVFSLGKEHGAQNKLVYSARFYRHVWRERHHYDAVFVHMNQEYVLLAGVLWRLLGKKILLWRNHAKGSVLTNIAVALAHRVFATSPFAYVARFRKTVIMPAGIDTDIFTPGMSPREKNSILMLGRISPVKKVDVVVRALYAAREHGWNGRAVFYGEAPARDREYGQEIRALAGDLEAQKRIAFFAKVNHHDAPHIYNQYELFINATPVGSLDKTMFEAMASGMLVLVSNQALTGLIPQECLFAENDSDDLARKIGHMLALSDEEKARIVRLLREYVIQKQSLAELIPKIVSYAAQPHL